MKSILLILLGITPQGMAAVSYSIDFGAGTISDSATSAIFATFTTTNGVGGDSAGLRFTTQLDQPGRPNAASRNGIFNITLIDSDYSLSEVVWRSRGGTPIQLGGAGNSSNMATVGISLNQDGSLTTNNNIWTNGGVATTNLVAEPYSAGTVVTHARSGDVTLDDHWAIVSSTNLNQAVNITKVTSGNILNEVFRADLTFDVVPEPTSSALLIFAGVGLVARRRR